MKGKALFPHNDGKTAETTLGDAYPCIIRGAERVTSQKTGAMSG